MILEQTTTFLQLRKQIGNITSNQYTRKIKRVKRDNFVTNHLRIKNRSHLVYRTSGISKPQPLPERTARDHEGLREHLPLRLLLGGGLYCQLEKILPMERQGDTCHRG